MGLITAGLTACYMFRLLFLTFWGEFRGTEEQAQHLHESPKVMTVPLWILAVGAMVTGFLGIPPFLPGGDWIGHFLEPVIAHVGDHDGHHAAVWLEWVLMAVSVGVALIGIRFAWRLYGDDRGLAGDEAFAAHYPIVHRLLANKYWVDELYDTVIVTPLRRLSRGLWKFIDGVLIDGLLVHGSAFVVEITGDLWRFTITGNVRTYALYFVLGLLAIFWWVL